MGLVCVNPRVSMYTFFAMWEILFKVCLNPVYELFKVYG